MLQGEVSDAGINLQRFTTNSLIGVAGFFDLAGYEGVKSEEADFGQTLGKWGVGGGPFIVLPLIGPSNLRDAFGFGLEWMTDPINMYSANVDEQSIGLTRTAVEGVSSAEKNKELLENLRKTSTDFYLTSRSMYLQKREKDICRNNEYMTMYSDVFNEDFDE
jgi:phospholipid-binding lipoprotein MlaA